MLGSDMLNHRVRGYTEHYKIQYYSEAPTLISVLHPLCKPWTTEQCGFGICWIWPRLQPVFTYASLQCQHLTLHQFYKCSQEFPMDLNSFYHWNYILFSHLFYSSPGIWLTDGENLKEKTTQKILANLSLAPHIFSRFCYNIPRQEKRKLNIWIFDRHAWLDKHYAIYICNPRNMKLIYITI